MAIYNDENWPNRTISVRIPVTESDTKQLEKKYKSSEKICQLWKSTAIKRFGQLHAVWSDWAIYWTLGHFLKPLATINLPNSPTFLSIFCKVVKKYHFSSEIIFEQLLLTFGDFLLVTLSKSHLSVTWYPIAWSNCHCFAN